MADNHDPHRDDAITPSQVNLNAQPRDVTDTARRPIWRQHPAAVAALGLCLMALIGVVFFLPSMVSPIQNRTADEPALPMTGTTQAARSTPDAVESPWQDAQSAKARHEAQTILQQLLEQQEALEAIRVDVWAPDAFKSALAEAEAADEHYQRREFSRAQGLYQGSLEQMLALLEQSELLFESALETGAQAIDDGKHALALEQFQLASYIKPDHEAVQLGLQRAAVLGDVLTEINAGEKSQRQGQLDSAREHYERALNLDKQSRLAQERLADLRQTIAERDFGRHMSTGFAAMADKKYPAAIAAFEQALSEKSGAADAQAALVQARNQNTQTHLQTLLQQAKKQEQQEQWQAAADRYQEALKVDANLVEARVGSIRAGTRAEIDENLERILATPQRLTTPAVHRDFQLFHDDTRRINNPGPRLQRQLQELEQALNLAVQPVTVQFRSDSTTQVTLYKVAELGSFDQRQLSLKPGSYTLVGSRPGYRDVRQAFTVAAGQTPVITIQCEEKINEG